MIRVSAALMFLVALAVHADERIAAATNHLAQIVATSHTFSITYGPQGALEMSGYSSGTDRAFRVSVNGREMLCLSGRDLWLAGVGTNGETIVTFEQPLLVGIGYSPQGSAFLSFGVVPPNYATQFVSPKYAGLASRLATLPVVNKRPDGWSFCDTNEASACIEITDARNPDRVEIALLRTEPDKSSVFIHSLRVTTGNPPELLPVRTAKSRFTLPDFSVAMRFCANVVLELQQSAMEGKTPENVQAAWGRHLELARGGAGKLPPLPPSLMQRMKPPPLQPK